MRKSLILKTDLKQSIKIQVLLTTLISLVFAYLNPLPAANAAANPLEIISVTEVSDTSVEILFNSKISKSKIKYYVITAAFDTLATNSPESAFLNPSNLVGSSTKKVLKVKSTGLISTKLNNLSPKAPYIFTVSANINQGKLITSESINYLPLSNLMDAVSNLPADWGNPKPIQLPTPAPTSTPLAAPAFTLSASSETRTVNTAATGFTVTSTGGDIASFAISATPPGMSFNTSTGALTGTPNTVAGSTAYTITATNASGSATRTFTLTVTAVVYTVGQTGPGGGKIFYVAPSPFACGPTLSSSCTYLEAAPTSNTVANYWTDGTRTWSTGANQIVSVPNANETTIGTGYKNSLAIVAQTGNVGASSAAVAARDYGGPNSLSDWYLPSKDELNQLYLQKTTVGDLVANFYWSSSEYNTEAANAWVQRFSDGLQGFGGKNHPGGLYVRPVRAF